MRKMRKIMRELESQRSMRKVMTLHCSMRHYPARVALCVRDKRDAYLFAGMSGISGMQRIAG
jgi:hypothetical protein